MQRIAIAVSLVALGVGLGWLWFHEREPHRAAGQRDAFESRAAGRSARSADADVDADAPASRGHGTVSGVVKGASGKPLSGVTIIARRSLEYEPVLGQSGFEEFVRRARAALRSQLQTVTDDRGEYRIDGLATRQYTLDVYRPGSRFRCVEREMNFVPDAQRNFVGTPAHLVSVRVVTPRGASIDDLKVEWTQRGERKSRSMHQKTARFVFEDADAEIRARLGESFESPAVRLTRAQLAVGAEVVLVLESGSGLHVHVVWPDTLTSRRIRVLARRVPGDDPNAPATLDRELVYQAKRLKGSIESGFSAREIELGTYDVALTAGSWIADRRRVVVGASGARVELRGRAPDAEEGVWVTVTGPDGALLKSARIVVRAEADRFLLQGGGGVMRDAARRVFVRYPLPTTELSIPDHAEWYLTAGNERLGTKRVLFDREAGAAVPIQLAAPVRVHAELPDSHRAQASEHRASVLRGPEQLELWREFDSKGVAVFKPMQPGRYVFVLHEGRDHGGWPIAVATADLTSGTSAIRFDTTKIHELVIDTGAADAKLYVSGRTPLPCSLSLTTGSDGRRTIHALKGTYEIRAGNETKTVVIPGDSVVRFGR